MTDYVNDHLVLISGKSATGKSACLMGLENPEGVMYLNCENNKKLPFRSKFMELTVTDPLQVYEAFEEAESMPDVHTIVVDTATYMMDMFESMYVLTAADTRSAWGDYAQFWKKLMQNYVANSTKNVIFLAHTSDVMNETDQVMESFVKFKGSIMNNGVESYFSTVISTKRVPLKDLKEYDNDMLDITKEDEAVGFKYVFQTKLTKKTTGERIRSSLGMWDRKETFIDNNAQHVVNRLREYY
ncbi:AAA domain protein [Vibrio virus vB_VspP_SBP1]|uniref:AAA domain protein n=1 Tax=Vibrio virus vB_VspP_SBP1 TaxID=2500581 RepID=A0A3T0IIL9_9CAUD|nr:Sak4-like ssDNA annealing protein [Vibrio virus vB_VspP_SBP1]AZU99633.1 AAA domain protein [Vibrio virus vB_VspP_SBP1]